MAGIVGNPASLSARRRGMLGAMTTGRRPRRVGFVIFPTFNALDLSGPLEVFSIANELTLEREPQRRPPYETIVLGLAARAMRAESGLMVLPQATLSAAPPLDTLLVPGGCGLRRPRTMQTVSRWLGRQAPRLRRIASVCTGAYALAEAGLLDGCRVTTHWRHIAALAARYPRLSVEADAIFLRAGKMYTSAGISAGIDLALALVAEDEGTALSLEIARELVVHVKRDGNQTQRSAPLALQIQAGDRLGDLAAWMLHNLDGDLSVDQLARRCHLSPRQLNRRFHETFGQAPAQYIEQLRISEACAHLGNGRASIARVAAAVGFRSADVFRRAFLRQLGLTPGEYRAAPTGGRAAKPSGRSE
jgi:transcriptional regulator GlxA family with amidase domain